MGSNHSSCISLRQQLYNTYHIHPIYDSINLECYYYQIYNIEQIISLCSMNLSIHEVYLISKSINSFRDSIRSISNPGPSPDIEPNSDYNSIFIFGSTSSESESESESDSKSEPEPESKEIYNSISEPIPIREKECIICMERASNYVITTCWHKCLCYDCGVKLIHCPICRTAFNYKTELKQVYES